MLNQEKIQVGSIVKGLLALSIILGLTFEDYGGPQRLELATLQSESCKLPSLASVTREWALSGHWGLASSVEEDQLYGMGEAITIQVGNSERYVDGCGPGDARNPVLKLRWMYNGSSSPQGNFPSFPRWSRSETCRALGGRWVLVVGDSLSGEFYDSLVSSLYVSSEFTRPVSRAPTRKLCDDGPYPPLNASFVNFDHLTFKPDLIDFPLWRDTAKEILYHVRQAEAVGAQTIVVLNRGAHVKSDVEGDLQPPFTHDQIFSAHLSRLNFTIEWFKKTIPSAPLFWRTTTTGHPLCRHTLNSPPLAIPQNLSDTSVDWEALEGSDYFHRFHWDLIPEQNARTLAALPPMVHVLDVAPATALRHDSHPHFKYKHRERQDCLHYCLPGPVDMWVELFAANVRYGEYGGKEFFTEQQLRTLCAAGTAIKKSRHSLFNWNS